MPEINCPYTIDDNNIMTIIIDLNQRHGRTQKGEGPNTTIASTGGKVKIIKDNKHLPVDTWIDLNVYTRDLSSVEKLQQLIEIAKTTEKNNKVLKTLEACKESLEGRYYQFKALFDIIEEAE